MTTDETTFYAAVGIPQGLIADTAGADTAGAVRRGGELVSLTIDDYALWSSLATPMSWATINEAAAVHGRSATYGAVQQLKELNLVLELNLGNSLGEQLRCLRPIPRGAGVGNVAAEPGTYQIKDEPDSPSPAVAVDPVAIMLWWEFDGSASLERAVANVTNRLPELPRTAIERLVVLLLFRLMAQRLVYLDIAYET